ncbi:hypothetical protein KIN20_007986 [Parelaphostrongylus tenuis]|uniref:Uncharacterized protein n=1 Tax=Parelaphostrongylus tenuis TaxID=148309 RepID=A0AAD5QKE3_PARTN|nr:hypothetical protein KIN20_007986 [Parelaphostrongylus tenuis]
MNTLFNLESVALREALEGWAPNGKRLLISSFVSIFPSILQLQSHFGNTLLFAGQLINIDDLIDYVLYRGPVFSSEMNAFAHLSRPLGLSMLLAGAESYGKNHIPTGVFENNFTSDIILIFGYVLALVINAK